jgi:hypothetical protein
MGSRMAINTAMMAITTSSSTSVKPRPGRLTMRADIFAPLRHEASADKHWHQGIIVALFVPVHKLKRNPRLSLTSPARIFH